MADDHGPDAQFVGGGLVGFVEEGACDVAGAVAEEEDGVGDDFLGVAGCVGDLKGEDQYEFGVVGSCQEVADVANDFVVGGDKVETKCAGDVGAEEDEDEEAAAVGETVV